jgi:hypothetical protein
VSYLRLVGMSAEGHLNTTNEKASGCPYLLPSAHFTAKPFQCSFILPPLTPLGRDDATQPGKRASHGQPITKAHMLAQLLGCPQPLNLLQTLASRATLVLPLPAAGCQRTSSWRACSSLRAGDCPAAAMCRCLWWV